MQFGGDRDLGLACINSLLSGRLALGPLPGDRHFETSDIRRLFSNNTRTQKDLIPYPKHVSAWSGN